MIDKLISKAILSAQNTDAYTPCDEGIQPLKLNSADLRRLETRQGLESFVRNIIYNAVEQNGAQWKYALRRCFNKEVSDNNLNEKTNDALTRIIHEVNVYANPVDSWQEDARTIADKMIYETIANETWEKEAAGIANNRVRDNKIEITSKEVKTADGDWVKLYKLTPENFDPNTVADKRIAAQLYFHGSGAHAEELNQFKELAKLAEKTGIPVYTINYRNVSTSYQLNQAMGRKKLPCNLDTLREDGLAAFNYLLSDGIPSGKIEIRGWSLGGVVAGEVANALQDKVNLASCPYLTTQQTLSSFTRFLMAAFIGSNPHHHFGYLDPTKFYFKNRLPAFMADTQFNRVVVALASTFGRFLELTVAKPLLMVAATLLYLIAKPILKLTNWETNNNRNFQTHPEEKRRNLAVKTPGDILKKPNVSEEDHLDDEVILPLAALNPGNDKHIKANTFYNRSEQESHYIESGHCSYTNLTNDHGDNIDTSVANHIKTLNGETNDPITKYYPNATNSTEAGTLLAEEEARLNHFLQDDGIDESEKAHALIEEVKRNIGHNTGLHPVYVASQILTELEDVLSYATTQALVLTLYSQLLQEVSQEKSPMKDLLIDRRSGLFTNTSRFKATLKAGEAPCETTQTFALIQQAFHDRLEQLPQGTEPPNYTKVVLDEDVARNTYSTKDSIAWSLFGENKDENKQVETESVESTAVSAA